ncbi:DUF4381 domain-containing protein [Agarivorans aestuarii]|uniref:DUF4381 domain-containing protein n=1 Tax=Agarivorans aestuarii TaxID=1563703 RepID=UPI001C7FBBB2|nr:DUF4381 domain-containing protein [Agarivorans aestuarii]
MSKLIANLHPEGITPLTSALVEPSLPDPVSWQPNAPGWYVVMCVIALYLTYKFYLQVKQYRLNAYRRAVLSELSKLELTDQDRHHLPLLLKRTALYAYPREQVAALVGTEWEAWLDTHCVNSDFSGCCTGLLASLAYSQTPAIEHRQLVMLSKEVAHWVKYHEVNND